MATAIYEPRNKIIYLLGGQKDTEFREEMLSDSIYEYNIQTDMWMKLKYVKLDNPTSHLAGFASPENYGSIVYFGGWKSKVKSKKIIKLNPSL